MMVAAKKDAAAESKTPGKLHAKFVPFTQSSLDKIADRIAAENARSATDAQNRSHKAGKAGGKRAAAGARRADRTRKNRPNTSFVAGKQFPEKFGIFPRELYGKPIEDMDEFYRNRYVSLLNF